MKEYWIIRRRWTDEYVTKTEWGWDYTTRDDAYQFETRDAAVHAMTSNDKLHHVRVTRKPRRGAKELKALAEAAKRYYRTCESPALFDAAEAYAEAVK